MGTRVVSPHNGVTTIAGFNIVTPFLGRFSTLWCQGGGVCGSAMFPAKLSKPLLQSPGVTGSSEALISWVTWQMKGTVLLPPHPHRGLAQACFAAGAAEMGLGLFF